MVHVRFAQYVTHPDETEFVVAEYRVVFDRSVERVRIDRPGYTLVCDDQDVVLVADALPGRHLRVPLEGKFTYERLVEVFPDLAQPIPPALVMLMSDAPIEQISGGAADRLTRFSGHELHDASSPQALLYRMVLNGGQGEFGFDAASRLIESMLVEVDPQRLIGSGIEAVRMSYDISWSGLNEAVDGSLFDLDLKQSHEFTTLAGFLSPGGGGQAGAGGGQGAAAGGDSLVGMPLPEVELPELGSDKKVKLSELDEGVVVLECFATWSNSSVMDLPALAEFKQWCKDKKFAVRVYGVAVGEQEGQLTQWMQALSKTAKREIDLPILLDTSTEAAVAMRLPTVPRTLIVVDGRVVEVYGGLKPTYLDDLKQGMPGWLDKSKSKQEQGE